MKEKITKQKLLIILSVLLEIDDIEIIKCVLESIIEELKDSN